MHDNEIYYNELITKQSVIKSDVDNLEREINNLESLISLLKNQINTKIKELLDIQTLIIKHDGEQNHG